MKKLKEKLDFILEKALIFIMAVMVINVLWQVFSRFIISRPSSFTEELARYSLIWLSVLGAGYVTGKKMHLAIDILPTKAKGKNKIFVEMFIDICVFLFSATVMIWGGYNLVYISFQLGQVTAAMQIPIGYIYLVVPISGLFMVFYSFYFLEENFKKLKKELSKR